MTETFLACLRETEEFKENKIEENEVVVVYAFRSIQELHASIALYANDCSMAVKNIIFRDWWWMSCSPPFVPQRYDSLIFLFIFNRSILLAYGFLMLFGASWAICFACFILQIPEFKKSLYRVYGSFCFYRLPTTFSRSDITC